MITKEQNIEIITPISQVMPKPLTDPEPMAIRSIGGDYSGDIGVNYERPKTLLNPDNRGVD